MTLPALSVRARMLPSWSAGIQLDRCKATYLLENRVLLNALSENYCFRGLFFCNCST